MSGYQFKGVEEDKGRQYLPTGIHQVCVESVKLEEINTGTYSGKVIDIVFKGTGKNLLDGSSNKGLTTSYRLFPYKFNSTLKDFNGNPKTEQMQSEEYTKRLIHLLNKPAGEERFNKFFDHVTDFDTLAKAIEGATVKSKGGNDFILKIRNIKDYAKVDPYATSGIAALFSESIPEGIIWNEKRDAIPAKPSGATEDAGGTSEPGTTTGTGNSSGLPWD